jgi:hypothetical protein
LTVRADGVWGLSSAPGPIAIQSAKDSLDPSVLGVREVGKNNHGPSIKVYLESVGLKEGDPWCQAFVYYRHRTAAANMRLALPSDYPKTGYTPTAAAFFKRKALWTPKAAAEKNPSLVQPGDLAYFFFSKMKRIAHVGIVVEVHSWGVVTVEGNTSSDGGVNRDGGGVYKKRRNWSELGLLGGFGRVPF